MRDPVFDRVLVDFLVRGSARVSWRMTREFAEPLPWIFQLEAGESSSPASGWVPVGLPAEGAQFAVDDTPRVHGTVARAHYRVRVTTGLAVHISRPTPVNNLLGPRDWLLAREIVRKETLLLDRYVAIKGWLLKRLHAGTQPAEADPRTALTDPLTGEIIHHASAAGLGTEFEGGYFRAAPFMVLMEPGSDHTEVDSQQRGNVDQGSLTYQGRIVVIPQVDTRDLFVAEGSDLRYYIHLRKQAATVRGVPVVRDCEFRQAEFDDVAYDVPLT